MTKTYGIKITFGIPKAGQERPLPEGWTAKYDARDFARAFSPDGQQYFLGPENIWKEGFATQEMVELGKAKKIGDSFIASEPLPLPT